MKKDLKNYKIRLNMRAMCMYEAITGKSFFDFSEDNMEDMFKVLYCSFAANNDLKMTLDTFLRLLEDEEVQKWLIHEYEKILDKNIIRKEKNNVKCQSIFNRKRIDESIHQISLLDLILV